MTGASHTRESRTIMPDTNHTPCDEDRSRLFADLFAQSERTGRALEALDAVLKAAEHGPVDEWTVRYFRTVHAELLNPGGAIALADLVFGMDAAVAS